MTGPEHYAEAERLVTLAGSPAGYADQQMQSASLTAGQVHATLALAAATIQPTVTRYLSVSAGAKWGEAIS